MSHNPLEKIIEQRLLEGPLTFPEFMNLALYHPHYGYYSGREQKFGAQGDFITAPELSPLFSQCLADQCVEIFQQLQEPKILEVGAGSGVMAKDLLLHLESIDQLPDAYLILEVSGDLRQRQQKLLQQHCPQLMSRIHWLDQLPAIPFNGVILGNEILDAMPVHLFALTETGLVEKNLTLNKGKINWTTLPIANKQLAESLRKLTTQLQPPYTSEFSLAIPSWINTMANLLSKGIILLLDYGFPEKEYYHPQRNQGTLMCHYQHQAHGDPLLHIGQQDITSHVNFTQVANTAVAAGLNVAGFTNQGYFLTNLQVAEKAQAIKDEIIRYNQMQQVKQLILPSEMGELFKVIALSKNYNDPLRGFAFGDQCHRL